MDPCSSGQKREVVTAFHNTTYYGNRLVVNRRIDKANVVYTTVGAVKIHGRIVSSPPLNGDALEGDLPTLSSVRPEVPCVL
jgi:hypothetical protein